MLRRNFFSSTKSRSFITCSTASTIISSVSSSSFRFAAASSSSTAATPSITSKQDIDLYKKKAHALFMLRNTPQLALSSEAAIRLITDDRQSNKTIPETEKMTREEAKQFLRDCHDAGIVVISPSPTSTSSLTQTQQQLVITEPNAVFSAYRNSDKLDFVTSAVDLQDMCQTNRCYEYHQQAKPHILQKGTAAVLAAAPDEVAAAAKRAHSRFWAWIAFGMSCQMLLFAYWTFLVYDWDTMEPFTYFVGCGYMLAFFAYFVRTRRGHTFGEMDRLVLSSVVKNRMVVRKNVKSV